MLRNRRGGGRLLAAVFAVLVLSGGNAAAAPPGAVSGTRTAVGHGAAQNATTHIVTLITGDAVQVTGKNVAVLRGEGRAHITFTMSRVKGHVRVIPSDARPLLASGRLDARLFDVTSLIEYGYDQRRGDLPLIVSGQGAPPPDAGLALGRALKAVKGQAAKADKDRLGTLWKGLTGKDSRSAARSLGAAKVWLDGVRRPTLDVSVPLIGAPTAWQSGWTGAGVKVAVLDTGIDTTHPDLAGRIAASVNFAAEFEEEDDRDHVGHGTHVASTIAGSGAGSNGKYKGVAPDAQLLNGKVCVQYGCAESWILAGMQWAAESGADVVNMSLGGQDFAEIDPLEQAVNDLTAQYGTLFVIAAGNEGDWGDRTVGSPASADAALAVAATTKTDELTSFSSRGPRVGDGAVKPEIAAPGQDIVAARSSAGFLGEPGELYMPLSGTSMATPHTAAAAALLAQQHPQWTPGQLKAALMGSATPLDGIGAFGQGAGRVDLARAIGQTVTAQQPSVSFGTAAWPHGDDTPIAKIVTYANSGSTDVTLQLAIKGTGAAMFALSATSVTVPAGGTASVTFTADTRADVPDGLYSGQLVGTAAGVSVSVPFGVEKEVESYTLALEHIGRDGAPSQDHFTDLVSETGNHIGVGGGTDAVRIPAGRYFLITYLWSENGEFTTLVDPKLVLDGDTTETLDARTAKPVAITSAAPYDDGEVTTDVAFRPTEDIWYSFASGGLVSTGFYSGQVGDEQVDDVTTHVSAMLYAYGPDGDHVNVPSLHYGVWKVNGYPTGFARRIGDGGLATQKVVYRQNVPGATAFAHTFAFASPDDSAWATGLPFQTPLHRTIYYDAAGYYQGGFDEMVEDGQEITYWASLYDSTRHYKTGKTPKVTWNGAAYAPAFGEATSVADFVSRRGDLLVVVPPLFGDAAGHAGYGTYATGSAKLYRNGVLIADEPTPYLEIAVPAEEAEYRVELEVTRDARLGTTVKGTWTFRSAHTDPDGPNFGFVRLPVTGVGFAPDLDDHNYAAATPIAMVPVVVSTHPGIDTPALRRLEVQVSTDDGKKWKSVPVVRTPNGGWYAFVAHKAGTFVSLRAHGVDTTGHLVDETLIRAYQVR